MTISLVAKTSEVFKCTNSNDGADIEANIVVTGDSSKLSRVGQFGCERRSRTSRNDDTEANNEPCSDISPRTDCQSQT
jgi:hypothetical protein